MSAAATTANQIFRQLCPERTPRERSTYLAVPGGHSARWLVPEGCGQSNAVLANWRPYRWHSRVAWRVIDTANRLGWLRHVPGVSVAEVRQASTEDWRRWGWLGHTPPIAVIYLGTLGPQRKAVLHLVNAESGRCEAVMKAPLTDAAKSATLHEADVLEMLATEGYDFAPRILHRDPETGITIQTFVDGCPQPRKLDTGVWDLLRSLMLAGETTSLAIHAEQWKCELAGAYESHDLDRVVAELAEDDSSLPACWVHSDFTPWNIKRLPTKACALLDWEHAWRGGLPLIDAFHFLHIQDFLFNARPRLHTEELAHKASELGVNAEQSSKLEAGYLVGAYVECSKQHNQERGRFVKSALGLWRRKRT